MAYLDITEDLRLSLLKVEQLRLFFDTLSRQPEYKDSKSSQQHIEQLTNNLKYSRGILNQLAQRAAAYTPPEEPE